MMKLAADQNFDVSLLSQTSQKMLRLREPVLEEWKKRVRSSCQATMALREPTFPSTIPPFFDNLIQTLSPGYPGVNTAEGASVAYVHGAERAKMTNYDIENLILEYQIFRAALFHVLADNYVGLNRDELVVINDAIDAAVRDAVRAFSVMVAQMREQFIAALTHDMRNPLHTAGMAVELIALTSNTPKIQELARRATESLARLDTMIQTTLDTTVFHRGLNLRLELSYFEVMAVVKEVAQNFVEKEGVRCEVAGAPVYGWWSQEAMYRSLENLIGNAVKYGKAGCPIRITVTTSQKTVRLSVHNEGLPIPVEEQEGIFQAFRRTEGASGSGKQGWGVGLPYVRAAVESMGGEIGVESTHERGTTFTMIIPLDARPFQSKPGNGSTDHQ